MNARSVMLWAAWALLAGLSPAHAVIGGREDAPLARHAVMVLSSDGGFCSAVVLASDVLLTAGHCATGAAGHRIHWRGAGGEPVMVEPAGVTVHPGFVRDAVKTRRKSVDLALIRLAEPLPAAFAPVALSNASAPRPGSVVIVGGYGLSAEGQAATGGHFRTAELGIVEPYGPSAVLLWLSNGKSIAAGACGGDSGGPVFAADGGLVAVTAFAEGSGGRGCGALTQAVLVAPQRAWIERVMAGWGRRPD